MSESAEQRLFDKLDEVSKRVNNLDVTISSYIASKDACKTRCDKTHDAMFGNGTMGVKAKMWVVWGGLGLAWAAIVAIAKCWIT